MQNNHYYAGYRIQSFATMHDRDYSWVDSFGVPMLVNVDTPRTYAAHAWQNGCGSNRYFCTDAMPTREEALELIYLIIDQYGHRWHELDT